MRDKVKVKVYKSTELPADWFKRANAVDDSESVAVEKTVKTIVADVKKRGDLALFEYAERFDQTRLTPENLHVSPQEIKAAYAAVTTEQIAALKFMKERLESRETQIIKREIQQQMVTSQDGITVKTTH
jgi:histidinol dehydrogenase